MSLNELLLRLSKQGCYPCISRRGDLWRAHVNQAGNYWEERSTPQAALEAAARAWGKAGKPMDGLAATKGGAE